MTKYLIVGDRVRVKATGDIMVVESKTEQDGKPAVMLSRWGSMAGAVTIHPETVTVKREDVVKVVAVTEWMNDED
jgi:hypothetical protein